MEIKTVTVIGLGALGVLFGQHLATNLPEGALRILADRERIERYERDGVYCNGERCRFRYITPEEKAAPADLLLFAVKFHALPDAIRAAANQVGPDTVILSLLNGISSEEIIGQAFGAEKVLPCVAQGMDAVKAGNALRYEHMGMLCFGGWEAGDRDEKVAEVARFFEKSRLPHEVAADMRRRLWGKFMLNVGVNQVVAVYESDYGGIQSEGEARDVMIAAMQEIVTLSEKENIGLTQADVTYWLSVLVNLNPRGKPSMRQDLEAKRKSEVELFAGTALALGRKHGLPLPVNQMLYDRIRETESKFLTGKSNQKPKTESPAEGE
jgi:2-dehydropantoate 2-reductase